MYTAITIKYTWGNFVHDPLINHLPDYSNQLVESLVYVHTNFGGGLHVCDLQLSGQLLALFLGYLSTNRTARGWKSNVN